MWFFHFYASREARYLAIKMRYSALFHLLWKNKVLPSCSEIVTSRGEPVSFQ